MEFQCASIREVDYSSTKASLEDEQVEYSVQGDGKVLKPKMKGKVNQDLLQLASLLLLIHLILMSRC